MSDKGGAPEGQGPEHCEQGSFRPGHIIGAYRILSFIGRGGAGEVFKAEHGVTKRIEALKVLSAGRSPDETQRFLREVRIHASLSHPNIASVYNAFWVGDDLVMAMEFIEGESLKRLLERGRPPLAAAIEYASQALAALAYAHDREVTHRDVAPGNMLLTAQGAIKLMDFGLARQPKDPQLTQSGMMVGSLQYMSPEQIRAIPPVDARADIYSMGAVLYELVTGTKPFRGDNAFMLMLAQVEEEPLSPIVREPTLPPGLSELILKALAKDPARRFQSAQEFHSALQPFRPSAALPSDAPVNLEPHGEPSASLPSHQTETTPAAPLNGIPALASSAPRSTANTRAQRLVRWSAIGAAALAVTGLVGIKSWRRPGRTQPPVVASNATHRVELRILPAAARVRLKGQDRGAVREVILPEGSHELEILLQGFQSQHVPVLVTARGARAPEPIVLRPLMAALTLTMSGGSAVLDDKPVRKRAGAATGEVTPGEHTLHLRNHGEDATIHFRIEAGVIPEVTAVRAKNVNVTAVAVFGTKARVHRPGTSSALEITGLAPGPQLLSAHKAAFPVTVGDAPGLHVFVTDPVMSQLLLTANEDQAEVLINGTRSGMILNGAYAVALRPGVYAIALNKPGFTSSTHIVRVEMGKARKENFALVRNTATLAVVDAPGAQLYVDGAPRGVVTGTGALELHVEPGIRKIQLRKEGFAARETELTLRPAQKLTVPGKDYLKPLGKVHVTVTPKQARLHATGAGYSEPLAAGATWLAPGDYKIVAKAEGFVDEARTVKVRGQEVASITFSLVEKLSAVRTPTPTPTPSPAAITVSNLVGPWNHENGWWTFVGRDKYSLLDPTPQGTITFQVQRQKTGPVKFIGKERASWVAFFIDARNHLLFELETGSFTVTEIVQGARTVKHRVPIQKDASNVGMQLFENRVLLTIGETVNLETAPDQHLFGGKFGFRGRAVIKDFGFTRR